MLEQVSPRSHRVAIVDWEYFCAFTTDEYESRGARFCRYPMRRVCSHAWVGWRLPARWLSSEEALWKTSRILIN